MEPNASEPTLLLLHEVPEPYRAALAAAARRQSLAPLQVEGAPGGGVFGRPVALVVAALARADEEALGRLRALRKGATGAPAIVLAPDTIGAEAAVRVLREGAADLIVLPASAEDVAARALSHVRTASAEEDDLVGRSAAMEEVRREIAAVAPLESTVLLLGETGTGKGVAARRIHRASRRAGAPFVHVDCAALSPGVIESELFGHERGAFTGAAARRAGRFELAGQGTIFLDEIGDLEPRLQSKLLRVLQDREYERLGGTRTLVMNARVIAATSHDLRRAVEQGRFRADLYFRLNVFRLRMPPLRERRGDLPLLVRAAVDRASRRLGLAPPGLAPDLHEALAGHDWPGNVRELVNVVERMLVRHRGGPIDAGAFARARDDEPCMLPTPGGDAAAAQRAAGPDAPAGVVAPADAAGERGPLRDEIAAALLATGGNVARTARRLGLPRSTLRYWIQQHGLGGLVPRD